MKKGYYEYDPVIYPRKLWVMPQATEAEIRMCFTEHDGEEIEWDDKECFATTFPEVCAKADGKYGVLVAFKGKASMTMGNICHEASHVLDDFIDVLPLAREPRGHNEHLSYLLQWIGDCMNRARLGKGEFVEIKALPRPPKGGDKLKIKGGLGEVGGLGDNNKPDGQDGPNKPNEPDKANGLNGDAAVLYPWAAEADCNRVYIRRLDDREEI